MTDLVHKYAELHYTMPAATVATILCRAVADPSDQVTLFASDGGITAAVTLHTGYDGAAQAVSDAVALASAELYRHIVRQSGIPAPWRVLVVDRDGLANHFGHPETNPGPETSPRHDEDRTEPSPDPFR